MLVLLAERFEGFYRSFNARCSVNLQKNFGAFRVLCVPSGAIILGSGMCFMEKVCMKSD